MENKKVPGYLNCFVTPDGEVYNNGILKLSITKGVKAPKIRLQENGIAREYGLATLVAQLFVPNPHQHSKVICKDGNNRNCHSGNLAWVCNREYVRHSLFPGKPLELPAKKLIPKKEKAIPAKAGVKNRQSLLAVKKKKEEAILQDAACVPIPGFSHYYITPCGKVYSLYDKARLLTPQQCINKAARVKLTNSKNEQVKHTVAWLLATTFISNPDNHPKVVFINKNKNDFTLTNLRWVSQEDYHYFYHSSADILGPPRPRKKKMEPVWIDPDRVPVEDFEGYFISPKGIVYKGKRIIKPKIRRGKALQVSLAEPGTLPIIRRYFGLATLIAQHFIPNPKNHEYVIFKDRNNHNCCKENIAWVDGETFMFYCGVLQNPGRTKKIVLEREDAIARCTDPLLRSYYQTLDEYWLLKCWERVEERLQHVYQWEHMRSDCYLYFLDRAKRFSMLYDPIGMLFFYLKGLKAKLRQEISTDIPYRLLMQTDESLRNIDQYANLEE